MGRWAAARARVRRVVMRSACERRASPSALASKRERWSRVVWRVAATSWRDLVGSRSKVSRFARGKGAGAAGSGWAVRATMKYGECTAW